MTELHTPFDDETPDEAPVDEKMAADFELIIEALNGHLSPERVAEVTRRLEEDAAFRDLAAPMLLTWNVPSYLERHPRPVGELEQAWNDFAERAGISTPPVRKGWRRHPLWRVGRTMLLLILLLPFVPLVSGVLIKVVPMSVWAWIGRSTDPAEVAAAAAPYGRTVQVGYDTAWIPVGGTGLQVRPALGADLRVAERRTAGKRQLLLESGAVRFRVAAMPGSGATARHQIVVHTPAGLVSAGESEFTVKVSGDSTDIEVHASGGPGSEFRPVEARLSIVRGPALSSEMTSYTVPLAAGERMRLVRGQVPARFARNP